MKSTETVAVRKIDLTSHRDEIASKHAAVETPVTIYVNTEQVATLFATLNAQPELASDTSSAKAFSGPTRI